MRKKHPEHVNLERWLVSYADFITLLFAFFVVMFAISQADTAKFKKVSESLRAAFESGSPLGMVDLTGRSGGTSMNQFEEPMPVGGRAIDMPAGKTNTAAEAEKELRELREKLEETISIDLGVTDPSDKLEVQYDSRGLVVRMSLREMFVPGKAELHPDLLPLLDRIGRVLSTTPRLIRIEGHTDPREMEKSSFKSGWELSAMRAAAVAAYWSKRFDFNSAQVGVAGYSSFRPIGDNKTDFGRAANRRIEIVVLNNQY